QGQPAAQEAYQGEPVAVAGYLDLRDEGYGFLRVNGYLASRDDVYVSVKQTRQYGLRKGDHVTGLCRPAGRNEKNPALLRIDTVNGGDPEQARNRPKFEDLTPLFPDEEFRLEHGADPTNMTARIIDLAAPTRPNSPSSGPGAWWRTARSWSSSSTASPGWPAPTTWPPRRPGASWRVVSTPAPCTRRRSSSVRPGTSRRAARSPSWPRRWSR